MMCHVSARNERILGPSYELGFTQCNIQLHKKHYHNFIGIYMRAYSLNDSRHFTTQSDITNAYTLEKGFRICNLTPLSMPPLEDF